SYVSGIYNLRMASSTAGNVTVNDVAGDIALGEASAPAGQVSLTASGAILDGLVAGDGSLAGDNGATDVTALTANLQAPNGVGTAADPIDTAVGHLQAGGGYYGGGTGGVWVDNAGDLVVDGASAQGNIVLRAGKTAGAAGNLALSNMGWVSSYG